ncbi:MAG: DUF3619 family protein [Sideroxydans sp.]|nr:DUF3619 family protein [Sideroxydans sp.]
MGIKLKISDVSSLLTQSATQIDATTRDKLHAARRNALQFQQVQHRAPVVAWLHEHGVLGGHDSHAHSALNFGLAALLALTIAGGWGYWQHSSTTDYSEVDLAILTDELPLHMYVD